MEDNIEIIFAESVDQLEKQIEKRKVNHAVMTVVLFLSVIYLLLFSLPLFSNAYADSGSKAEPAALYEAEKIFYLYQYHSNSLIQEDKKTDLIDILPSPVYHSDSNYYLYSGTYAVWETPARRAWKHARDLYYRGNIHGSSFGYQCTFFAQMWFYDIYGFNSSGNQATGDGKDFARTVYNVNTYYDEDGNLKHYFEYGNGPKTMGIVSISYYSNENGHVICVDEVDYLNDLITISDGNISNNGDVRIRVTMSLSQFYHLYPGYYTFVNPTKELLETLKKQG